MKDVLWIIPARSGSKSIPDKNIKILGNYPLLVHRYLSVKDSLFTHDVWLSTDSESYADIARQYNITVPFMRPDYLSTDDASSNDVVLHAMNFASQNDLNFDFVGLLEPTSPFIDVHFIDKALKLLKAKNDATGIVAVRESRPASIFVQKENEYLRDFYKNIQKLKKLGRQFIAKEITPSGGLYLSKWDAFLENKSFYSEKTLALEVDSISGLEIDEPIDWEFAEFIQKKFKDNEL